MSRCLIVLLTVLLAACGGGSGASDPTPRLSGAVAACDEDGSAVIALVAEVPSGRPAVFTLATPPAHGTAVIDGAVLTWAPAADWWGEDVCTVTVGDGERSSAPATLRLTVRAVNDAPVCAAAAVTLDEDGSVALPAAAHDADGQAVSIGIARPPAHGVAILADGVVTYTPEPGWSGEDACTISAFDGEVVSAEAELAFTVRPVNDAPVCASLIVRLVENHAAVVTLQADDVDGPQTLSFAVAHAPANGAIAIAGGVLTYTPDPGWTGVDVCRVTASDGAAESEPADLWMVVAYDPSPPVCDPQTLSVQVGASATVALTGREVHGLPLTFELVQQAGCGSAAIDGQGVLRYQAPADWSGTDACQVRAGNGTQWSEAATVMIEVHRRPVCDDVTASTGEDAPVDVLLAARVVGGAPPVFALHQPPAHGQAVIVGGLLRYAPAVGWTGIDSCQVTASDGSLTSSPATVTIVVAPVNDVPVVMPATGVARGVRPLTVALDVRDDDGPGLSVRVIEAPDHGTVEIVGTALVYTARTDYLGPDSCQVMADDGLNTSAPTMVTLRVVRDAAWADACGHDEAGDWADLHLAADGDIVVQRFRWCPRGSFVMGSPVDEYGRSPVEIQHTVILTSGFWIADSECTRACWRLVMGADPSLDPRPDPDLPVERVSWDDICRPQTGFLTRLAILRPDLPARLPTEAEWEYAARAGSEGPYGLPHPGPGIINCQSSDDPADPWRILSTGDGKTVPVRSLQANAWGLYDMHGNVFEWCADVYDTYPSDRVMDPTGPATGTSRVMRGGCWLFPLTWCRSASRQSSDQTRTYLEGIQGLRLAVDPDPAPTGAW